MIYTRIDVLPASTRARYSDFPERYHDRIQALSAMVEGMLGFHRLDEEVLTHPVLDRVPSPSNVLLGNAFLRDFLFSTDI